jgi:hypothetical protein
MLSLEKAKLYEIKANETGTPVDAGIDVQFNPQTLKLTLGNKVEGHEHRTRGNRQYLGKTSTTLAFDLHFDTADEGTDEAPVSVRSKTRDVEKFVLPKGNGNQKQKPPRVRFQWGDLTIDGIIDELAIDFDLFAANGTPLRAKMSVSIKEQDAKYRLAKAGAGANKPAGAGPAGGGATGGGPPGAGTGPGSAGAGPTDSTALALEGESAADFAARVGLDPAAWRGVAGQLGSTLSLTGGAEIDFSASLTAGAGVGISVGVEAGLGASLEASFGLDASAGVAVASGLALGGSASAGFALSAAGGVAAALETVAIVRTEKAAAEARQAFGPAAPAAPPPPPPSAVTRGAASVPPATVAAARPAAGLPPPTSSPTPGRPDQPRAPLTGSGFPSRTRQAAAPSAPPPPLADPRSTSYGFGVPLRPRVGSAADLRAGVVSGRIPLKPHGGASDVLAPLDPTTPPWVRLPADPGRSVADQVAKRVQGPRPCRCGGGCGHAGGAA